jgi:hypothetical protein
VEGDAVEEEEVEEDGDELLLLHLVANWANL